jgi:hypothetical protein
MHVQRSECLHCAALQQKKVAAEHTNSDGTASSIASLSAGSMTSACSPTLCVEATLSLTSRLARVSVLENKECN